MSRLVKTSKKFKEFEFKDLAPSSKYINVSLLNPKDDSELKCIEYADTIIRGGRRIGLEDALSSKLNTLKIVKMIKEGAVLNKKIDGKVVDISPNGDSSFLRNGKCICLPLNTSWHEK